MTNLFVKSVKNISDFSRKCDLVSFPPVPPASNQNKAIAGALLHHSRTRTAYSYPTSETYAYHSMSICAFLFCYRWQTHEREEIPHPWSHAKQTIDTIHKPRKLEVLGTTSRQGYQALYFSGAQIFQKNLGATSKF